MAELLTADGFARLDLDDWRWLLGRIEASFRTTGTFADAAALVATIGTLADGVDHHPALDLRYPGVVDVVLSTHDAGGVTERDVYLAVAISEAATTAGFLAEPRRNQQVEIGIDALDIDAVRPFWQAVLDYRPVDDGGHALIDPRGRGPAVWFQQMDEARPQRNRIHLDVAVPHDSADDRLAAALAAGGVLVSDARARAFWVLADAEGNEVCITTWQDRG